MCRADKMNELYIVNALIEAKANVNILNTNGYQAIHSVYTIEIATALIQAGADINAMDE